MTRRVRAFGLTAAGLTAAAVAAGGCSSDSTPPPRSTSTPPARIATPSPGQRGPQVTVRGTVYWRTNHPGCAEFTTASGQNLHLVGDLATQHEQSAANNAEPASGQVQITGYVPVVEPTVCGTGLPFVAEKVTTVTK